MILYFLWFNNVMIIIFPLVKIFHIIKKYFDSRKAIVTSLCKFCKKDTRPQWKHILSKFWKIKKTSIMRSIASDKVDFQLFLYKLLAKNNTIKKFCRRFMLFNGGKLESCKRRFAFKLTFIKKWDSLA